MPSERFVVAFELEPGQRVITLTVELGEPQRVFLPVALRGEDGLLHDDLDRVVECLHEGRQ